MAGTWEKTKHRQGGPYLKTGAMRWSQREKNPREPIAPSPHRFVFLIEMWVHSRQFSVAPAPSSKLKLCPRGRHQPHASLAVLLFLSGQVSRRSVSKHLSCRLWGPQATTRLSMDAVRWAAKEAQSQDRGTWRAQ